MTTATVPATMREAFVDAVVQALDSDERVVLVLADISAAMFAPAARRHPDRVLNVGIREQLLISVAGGLALTGLRPVVHSYAPFLVERPFEQLKLDLGHQDVGAVLVSIGASYDAAAAGRTHQAPEDVALLDALPGWTIHVPGHPTEAAQLLRAAIAGAGRVYLRLSDVANSEPQPTGEGLRILRRGSRGVVLAVGPTLDAVLAATAGLDITVGYLSTVRPFDGPGLRAALGEARLKIVLVEPYLAGTSARVVADALREHPHRQLGLGVRNAELRAYGSPTDHDTAHGLDVPGLAAAVHGFLG